MTKLIFLIFTICLPPVAHSRIIPIGIDSNQVPELTHKFGGLTSLNTSNSPFALGEDLEFELTGIYFDLEANDVPQATSEDALEAVAAIRKGLYWNIDLSFSFSLPVESHMVSGHLFGLSHSSKIGGFLIKPEIYISNYNLDDVFRINSSGLSLVAYKKISLFYLGVGGRFEFIEGEYEEKFLGSNTISSNGPTKDKINYTTGLIKLILKLKRLRLTTTYSISSDQESAALSLGVLL